MVARLPQQVLLLLVLGEWNTSAIYTLYLDGRVGRTVFRRVVVENTASTLLIVMPDCSLLFFGSHESRGWSLENVPWLPVTHRGCRGVKSKRG